MSHSKEATEDFAQQKEDLEHANTHGTYLDINEASHITEEHREYLVRKHGTFELDPLPTTSDNDPYNWSTWEVSSVYYFHSPQESMLTQTRYQKVVNLIFVAFHACMGPFAASAIIPAYEDIAADLGVTLTTTSYLTSLQIAVLGFAPLFWRPLSTRYGRRPIFIISLIGSLLFNVGCAKSTSYAAMATCRAFSAFFISPPSAIGSAIVVEMFFKRERAKYMGIWTVMLTVGIPLAPFIMGFVTYNIGYRWIYWIIAIVRPATSLLF